MEIRVQRHMNASVARVMQALTEPAELTRWCCEAAEVTPEMYRLTGSALPQGAMAGPVLASGERRLAFQWTLCTQPSQVAIELEPGEKGTTVRLAHTAVPKGALPGDRLEKDSWECVWVLWLRLLAGWVERGERIGAFDYTAPVRPELPVQRSLLMPVAAARIWQALVDPAARERWLTVPLGAELSREDGRRITFDWTMPEGDGREEVTWELEPKGEGLTLVTLRHRGLPCPLWDLELGWHDYLVALYQEAVKQ